MTSEELERDYELVKFKGTDFPVCLQCDLGPNAFNCPEIAYDTCTHKIYKKRNKRVLK